MCITRVLGVSKTAVLVEEFATFVDLELSLHIGAEELLPHFHRILLSLGLCLIVCPTRSSLLFAAASREGCVA